MGARSRELEKVIAEAIWLGQLVGPGNSTGQPLATLRGIGGSIACRPGVSCLNPLPGADDLPHSPESGKAGAAKYWLDLFAH